MYRGFDLNFNDFDKEKIIKTFFNIGYGIATTLKIQIQDNLSVFLSPDGTINASQMQESWFPKIKTDVFLSHSHEDKELAISIAGMFYANFNLLTFVDSCVWDYAGDLLKDIDKKYCSIKENSYDYDRRNFSTCHVHMILASALSKTIDNCECLFFLNTPESVQPGKVIDQTISPWIYYEVGISKTIRQHNPRLKKAIMAMDEGLRKTASRLPDFNYDLDKTHLIKIDQSQLDQWHLWHQRNPLTHPLDILYGINKIPAS